MNNKYSQHKILNGVKNIPLVPSKAIGKISAMPTEKLLMLKKLRNNRTR